MLASPGVLPAPRAIINAWVICARPGCVPDIENKACAAQDKRSAGSPALPKGAHRVLHTVGTWPSDHYLAGDKIEDICRHLACSKVGLKWRARYDATNPAWVQERPHDPSTPGQTPEHVARAIVSLYETLRHNGTGGGATVILQALTQQGIEPLPSRRTIYRILRRYHTEERAHGSHASMLG